MSISPDNRIVRTNYPEAGRPVFYTWSAPPKTHYAANTSLLVPFSRVLIGAIDSDPTSGLPSGFSTYGGNDPTGWAKRIADWQEYLGFSRGVGSQFDGSYCGFLFLQNWGLSVSGGLINNSLDAAGTGTYASYCCYNASGISVWRSLTQRFASGLQAELLSRTGIYASGLAIPALCDVDYESGFENILQPNNSGWFASATGDARYNTEIICETFVSASGAYVGRTLHDLYTEYRLLGSGDPNYSQTLYHASNRTFFNWWTPISFRVKEYALRKSLVEPMKSLFPYMRFGNYELVFPIGTGLWNDHYNTFGGITYGTGSRRISQIDFQSPNLYPPQMSAGRFDDTAGYGSTYPEISLNYNLGTLEAATSSGNPLSTIPWLPHPDKMIGDGGAVGHIQTSGEIKSLIERGSTLGINEWMLWYDNGQENWDTVVRFSNYAGEFYAANRLL